MLRLVLLFLSLSAPFSWIQAESSQNLDPDGQPRPAGDSGRNLDPDG